MIGSRSAQSPTVANGHGNTSDTAAAHRPSTVTVRRATGAKRSTKPRLASETIAKGFLLWAKRKWGEELPPAWRPVLADFPEHLQEIGLHTSSIVKILPLTLRFLDVLATPPGQVAKTDLDAALAKERSRAGALSYLCLYMADQNHWPKSFLRQRAEIRAIERYLPVQWRSFLRDLKRSLEDSHVPFTAQYYFMRISTHFLWQSKLPVAGSLKPADLDRAWVAFWQDAPDAMKTQYPRLAKNRERCFAALWNALLSAGRVEGSRKSFVQAAPPFWKTVAEPVRSAAHKLLGPLAAPKDGEIRRHMLLHAVTLLGFSAHGEARPLEIATEEWTRLESKLAEEEFTKATIKRTIEDIQAAIRLASESRKRLEVVHG